MYEYKLKRAHKIKLKCMLEHTYIKKSIQKIKNKNKYTGIHRVLIEVAHIFEM